MYKYLSSAILLICSIICFVLVAILEQNDKLNLNQQDCENSLKWPKDNKTCGVWSGNECLKGEITGLNCEHKTNMLYVLLLCLSLIFFVLSVVSFFHNYKS